MGRKLLRIALAMALMVGVAGTVTAGRSDAGVVRRAMPRVTVGSVSVAEGNTGSIVVQVPIDLSWAAPTAIPVTWTVTAGTATPGLVAGSGADYSNKTAALRGGTTIFQAGTVEKRVKITIFGDIAPEDDQTVFVNIVSAPGATVTAARGTVTIVNDDAAASSARVRAEAAEIPHVIIGRPTQYEGDAGQHTALVPVALSAPATSTVVVRFTSQGSDPPNGGVGNGDCNIPRVARRIPPKTVTVTFQARQQSATVSIPLTSNTDVDEAVESVPDELLFVSGSISLSMPDSELVILDDDNASSISGSPPPVGVSRVSEPWNGSNPLFPKKVANVNGCGYPESAYPFISGNGRYVTFSSNAFNLVPYDLNGYTDVFVKDMWTGVVTMVSHAPNGDGANQSSFPRSISADGRFVLFMSFASNIVPNTASRSVYVWDRQTDTSTALVGLNPGEHSFEHATMSDDNRYVAYEVRDNTRGIWAYVLDRTTGTVTPITDAAGNRVPAMDPAISGDGDHVAFARLDGLGGGAAYVKDLDTGALNLVGYDTSNHVITNGYPKINGISSDGNIVMWDQYGCTTPNAGSCVSSVRNRSAGTTTAVNVPNVAVSLTSDGAAGLYIDYTKAPDCPYGNHAHVYRKTWTTGTVTRVDTGGIEAPCIGSDQLTSSHMISNDGNYVVFMGSGVGEVSATNPNAVYFRRLQ